MKFIGSIMLITCFALAGINASLRLKIRYTQIQQIIALIKQIDILVGFCNMPTREIINQLCSTQALSELSFLSKCKKEYDSMPFDCLWEKSVKESKLMLDKDDIDLLVNFGKSLGTTDSLSQQEMCRSYMQRFLSRADFYKKEYFSRSKLYMSLGLFGGIGISLILI